MKKITVLLLLLSIFLTISGCVKRPNEELSKNPFITVKIPFPEEIKANDSWRTYLRYKDTKEPVTLSMFYNGYVYGKIPQENIKRELEAFMPSDVHFNDFNSTRPEYHNVEVLGRTGVIIPDENGNADVYANLSREDALSTVMRFLGIEKLKKEDYKNNFDDVSEDDDFYYAVMNACELGIVKSKTKNKFLPYENITREELTFITANALKYAGLTCSKPEAVNIADKDKISDYAKDSYEYIGRNYISDPHTKDGENPVRMLNPQKIATRADIAYLLGNIKNDCQVYPSETAVKFGFDKKMPVIDGSTSTYPFTKAVYGMLFTNGDSHSTYPQSHSKSHASYKRLIDGEVDMLFASVYPASDILKYAKDKGVELELIPIAYDAMIFFTNKENPAKGLTKEQITNIYVNDAYDNWSEVGGEDALLYPYCRNNDSGSHAQMEKHFLNGKDIHPEVKKETSYTMSNVLTDVMAAKTDNPVGYGLGYSIYYYYHNMFYFYPVEETLKLLEIDGIMPDDETIRNGTYPLSNNTYIVLRKDELKDSPARKMAEFMLTEEGQMCVENAGYGRLK